ncbi:hypothetical protein [Paraliobacillus sp. JSM ZJ581]|uniref:hypothetical protein n=1 Tax=Paraliobacillus sp. JSM ZJ581 TaxID=3342118 RepID=UPI0035A81C7E
MKNLAKKGMLFMLISTLVLFTLGPSVLAGQNTSIQGKLTGEEIYKGIVFGEGELAKKLQTVDAEPVQDAKQHEEVLELIDKIIGEIGTVDPNYFEELQAAAYSMSPAQLDKAIENGGVLLQKALDNMGYFISSADEVDLTAAVAGWVAMVGALAYNYAGAVHTAVAGVNAAAYLNLWVYQNAYLWGGKSASSQLEKDAYFIEIMDALN